MKAREIAGVGLGDRQRGQRPASKFGRELGRALQKPRVNVKNVARKGLPSRRLVGEERKLAVGRGVLGEVVDDDERMAALVAEVFGDGEAGEGRDPLQRGRGGGGGDDEDAALRRAHRLDQLDHALDRRRPLADRDIDADHVGALLVDDRVDGDRRLAGGAVADDQLPLAAAEGEQGVDHQHAGRDRLFNQRPVDDRRRRSFDGPERLGRNRLVAVERTAERVNDTPEQARADRHARDLAGRRHQRADAAIASASSKSARVDRVPCPATAP